MTRRDYELIAGVIHNFVFPVADSLFNDNEAIRRELAVDMANALQETNPRFDRARFIRAATGGN